MGTVIISNGLMYSLRDEKLKMGSEGTWQRRREGKAVLESVSRTEPFVQCNIIYFIAAWQEFGVLWLYLQFKKTLFITCPVSQFLSDILQRSWTATHIIPFRYSQWPGWPGTMQIVLQHTLKTPDWGKLFYMSGWKAWTGSVFQY